VIEKQSSNQKGGKRPGAGRKKGEPNKRTAEAQEKAAETGIMPLDYMLHVMRTSEDERMRMSAAQAAAPYVHAKLSSIEVTGKDGGALETVTRIELVAMRGNPAH
jgi:hypothetical protein